jgi:hypothetical protein
MRIDRRAIRHAAKLACAESRVELRASSQAYGAVEIGAVALLLE